MVCSLALIIIPTAIPIAIKPSGIITSKLKLVNYPTQTIYWFIGLIAFSIPLFLKGEMKGQRLAVIPFVCGLACHKPKWDNYI